MLVLTLDANNHARMRLGDGREVLVKWLGGKQASRTRVGIEAPATVEIVRVDARGEIKGQRKEEVPNGQAA